MVQFHATTICAVRRGPDDICIGGDGQVTMGETAIMKNGAKKVKKIYKNTVLTGFAGSVADAFSLTEKFESKLDEHGGNLKRAAVALAQLWRSDKAARNLEALMIVADRESLLVLSGTGEVIEPDEDFVAIGSGGNFAYSAAKALFNHYFIQNTENLGEWQDGVLTDIAQYLNGLAMQKYPAMPNEAGLPVLKIKELGQGQCDTNSDI